MEPNRVYQNYPKPLEVPKYEVVYPYESQRAQYYNVKLPERFPNPFSPNKDFAIRDPPPAEYPRREYGFYPTQTVYYDDKRASRKEQCNYIRLNEKGFPVGNEMCGRSVSDIILAPEYSTTGELILEHRKRYRGVNQRKKRSAGNEPRCCGDAAGNGYGFYTPDFGYDTRPYYNDEQEDYGQETSNNRGLTSYLTNRGRGGDEDDESNENESNRNQGNDRNQSGGNRHYQNRNRSRNQSSSNNRSRNNRRNFGSDENEGFSSTGSYSNRNNGNNYGYMRNDEPNRYYGGRYDSFRNVGGGSFGSYSPYSRYKK